MLLKTTPLSFALSGTALLVLSACGGSDDTASPVVPPTPITLTGKVTVDQGIKNAVVCMDLNANNACDANEPTSARTGADGAYSLVYDPAKVTAAQVADASLIAPMVPGAATDTSTTVDAADPMQSATTSAYVLRQAPGKSGDINPLTSLVAAGITQGMTESVARTNVAVQLGITEAAIDDYQGNPAFDPAKVQDNARMMAKMTSAALDAGAPLQVGDQTAAGSASAGALATLRYTDASNYYIRTLDVQAKAVGSSHQMVTDMRSGMTNGAATAAAVLYPQAYLSNAGWLHCNSTVALPSTRGNPNRSTFCNTQPSAGFTVLSDIGGQTMANVVTAMQADPRTNVINNGLPTASLVTALGSATFPPNASIQLRSNVTLAPSIYINDLTVDGLATNVTTLEQLIASYPSSTVNAGNAGRASLSLGLESSETRVLRVAFGAASSPTTGAVQFYGCDWNGTVLSSCAATQLGTYAISNVNGVRVLRYAGHTPTVMSHTRLHAEVAGNIPGITDGSFNGPRVFVARENKASLAFVQSSSKRLDSTAWSALKSRLGI